MIMPRMYGHTVHLPKPSKSRASTSGRQASMKPQDSARKIFVATLPYSSIRRARSFGHSLPVTRKTPVSGT